MNKASRVGWLVCGLILSGTATAVVAQQEGTVHIEAKEPEYSFGTVKKVAPDQIVISEFDYDTGEERDVTYWVDPKVQLNGVNSLPEIAAGDEVDVDFMVKDGKNTAVVLSVAKPVEAEGTS